MEKKSFLIYKDNGPMIRRLSQREAGQLFFALLDYAEKAEEGQQPEEFLEGRELSMAVQLVFGFVAANIYRDTQKWRRTQETKAARRAQRESLPSGESTPLLNSFRF